MKTYIVNYRDLNGYERTDLFTEVNYEILVGRLSDLGLYILSVERYA